MNKKIHLTDREKECLQLAATGMLAKESGLHLGVKVETVNIHLSNARKKLDARNTTQAVRKALNQGIIQ